LIAVGDEIPHAGLEDEAERRERLGLELSLAPVLDPDEQLTPRGISQLGEEFWRVNAAKPAGFVDVENRAGLAGSFAQVGGQRCQQLQLGVDEDRSQTKCAGSSWRAE
jgi:hypothetical protein